MNILRMSSMPKQITTNNTKKMVLFQTLQLIGNFSLSEKHVVNTQKR